MFPVPRTLEEGQLDAAVKNAARNNFVEEDVIVISDEEMERQDSRRVERGNDNLQSFGQPAKRVNSGCDAPRFPGGQSESKVHQEAGRPSGGQSVTVKVRAPLGHRREGKVKSGAVYPTARESVLSGPLGQRAGSVFDEQPSTTPGASTRFESPDEEWLDYEEDVEEQVIPALKSVVREATQSVPEVVRGDRFGNHHRDMAVGNLPRGEEFGLGSVNFGVERQVGVGTGTNVGSVVGGLVSRKGGVDVLIQVDSDPGNGAGKSEVGLDMVSGGVPKEDEAIEVQDSSKSVGVVSSGGASKEKVQQLISMLEEAVKKTKLELRQAQALLGHLNYACKVVRVGRAFCRRLGFAVWGAILPHHHIRLKAHFREDLRMWIGFLQEFNGVSMLVEDADWFWQVQIFSVASGANGFGLFWDGHWVAEAWPAGWKEANHSIAFLEFFSIGGCPGCLGPLLG
ncbi:hypothetical protein NDU88_005564 [Pleurodeles waltl]|uniref:Uncharacterized protein n=1 Tax=Pleurodeles waltl TaxID=8319 RepID=A0AAV7UMH0_PLEWA|nr:hypothetical protein NDU88_005564 [Pleurodeles waltl]